MEYRSPEELRRRLREELAEAERSPKFSNEKKTRSSSSPKRGPASSSFSSALPDDPTALVREIPLEENLLALSEALEHDAAVQRHMESQNLSLEEATRYIMINGSTGQKVSFFAHVKGSLERLVPKQMTRVISTMVDSMWAQEPELQLSAPESLIELLSMIDSLAAKEIYDVTITMLTVQTAQVRQAWGKLLLNLINYLSSAQLEQFVVPLALKKTEHSEHQDQRELSCNLLGELCKKVSQSIISALIVPKALALCQDTNASVRQHICQQLSTISRSLGIEAAEKKIAPEIFELLNDEEHCVSCQAFSCLLDLVEFFGAQYRKEKLYPVIRSYMLNPPTEVLNLLVGDFGRFLTEIRSDITTHEDVLLFANFFSTASQKLDDTAKWHCAYNFPAVAACLPLSIFPTHLSPCLIKLANNPVESVRKSIAAGLHELIPILQQNAATYLEKPFLALLTDSSPSVRHELSLHMNKVLECFVVQLQEVERSKLFESIARVLLEKKIFKNWRIVEQVLFIFGSYMAQFKNERLTEDVVPELFAYIKVGASSLKPRCAQLIVRIAHHISDTNEKVSIFSKINAEFGRSPCCFQRKDYFLFVDEICELFSCRFIRERLFEVCQELQRDLVTSVRLALARGMRSLGQRMLLVNDTAVKEVISTMSQRLQMDEATVVREAMSASKEQVEKCSAKYKRDMKLFEQELSKDKRRESVEAHMLEMAKEADKVDRRAKLRDLLKTEREKDYLDSHSSSFTPTIPSSRLRNLPPRNPSGKAARKTTVYPKKRT